MNHGVSHFTNYSTIDTTIIPIGIPTIDVTIIITHSFNNK